MFSLPPFNAPVRLTIVAESLEPVPTKAIPPKNANYTYDLAGLGIPEMNLKFNQYLMPEATYADMLTRMREGKEEVDVILVPGGLGTRLERTYGDGRNESNIQTLLDFLPEAMGLVKRAIITVCTGSDALARTGVLDGRRATTNMYRFDGVAARHQKVEWVKGARWVRAPAEEGKKEVWSSAGISAGMDVALAWVADYAGGGQQGMSVSRMIAKRIEYDWAEPADGQVKEMYKDY